MNAPARLLLLIVGLCAVLPDADATVSPASGIEGRAIIGPTCPVVRAGDQKCADRPYQTTIIVKTPKGLEIAHFSTDAQGKFHIPLEPDWYTIVAVSGRRMQVVLTQPIRVLEWPHDQVRVVAGEFTDLELVFDSGLR